MLSKLPYFERSLVSLHLHSFCPTCTFDTVLTHTTAEPPDLPTPPFSCAHHRHTAACSRSLVLKQCLQLPTPLWREVSNIHARAHSQMHEAWCTCYYPLADCLPAHFDRDETFHILLKRLCVSIHCFALLLSNPSCCLAT